MIKIIEEIRNKLKENSEEKIRKSGQTFFKEKVKVYGIKTALGIKIGKDFFNLIKEKGKKEIFALCEELWLSGYMEESFIACNWSYYLHEEYKKNDWIVFKRWLEKYVSNWASCDTLCNHTIGSFLEMYPSYVSELKKWAKSKNRWMRRGAAVSLIVPAKKGLFLKDIFEISEILLLDKDDLVQKGYGWMLKAASQAHEKEVFDFVIAHKQIMPRTALRYAIEKMQKPLKEKAMKR
jgi:3-methyladenine DNA glycosylase AlkD